MCTQHGSSVPESQLQSIAADLIEDFDGWFIAGYGRVNHGQCGEQ